MDDRDLYIQRAYAAKELLKQDLSIRIAEAINSAGVLYESLVFAAQVITETPIEIENLKQYEDKVIETTNPLLKQIWQAKQAELAKAASNVQETITRSIDPNYYRLFLIDFYKLWIESKDQISERDWARKLETQPDIADLFKAASTGEHNPRRALELFEEYMKTLAKSGILDFKFKTFKAGESWREGAG